jgi:hypothetical protein
MQGERDKLIGHQNAKQKIQHHIKIKEENNELRKVGMPDNINMIRSG